VTAIYTRDGQRFRPMTEAEIDALCLRRLRQSRRLLERGAVEIRRFEAAQRRKQPQRDLFREHMEG